MAFCYDNLKLDKGMYQEAGSTFTQVLERQDPSDQYKGTSLEGLDAFQRQLKRFDIRVKGAGSDVVEKFFRTADSAVLFPEYIARSVRQGMEESDILPHITAAVTRLTAWTTAPSLPRREGTVRSCATWRRAPPSPPPQCRSSPTWSGSTREDGCW